MPQFDLCVIGSGSGNSLITPELADWSIALVDGAPRFGGTCLNAGCIPTKMFAAAADVAEQARHAWRLGVHANMVDVDWTSIRDRVFGRVDVIAASGEAFRRDNPNVTLYREFGRFGAPGVLEVGDERIEAAHFVLAAGSRPRLPDIPGVDDPGLAGLLHTSETIMRRDALPARLVILGGGVVAVEFAHIFAGLGSQVTLVHRGPGLLRGADAEIAERFTAALDERVTVRLNQRVTALVPDGSGGVGVETEDADGVEYFFEGEQVLFALGRVPNSDRLDVAAAGLVTDASGRVLTDEYQRAVADDGMDDQVEGVWALGDICAPKMLKHVANHEARVVAHNLLRCGRAAPDSSQPSHDAFMTADHRFIPQAVFSGPQVAWVGLTEREAAARGPYVSSVRGYDSVAYGWAMEDDGTHAVKLLADPASGQLLGAHIIGPDAAILLQPLTQAMSAGLDARTMARGQYWIHPALAEVVENALLDLPLD